MFCVHFVCSLGWSRTISMRFFFFNLTSFWRNWAAFNLFSYTQRDGQGTFWQLVEIQDQYKGIVIGKRQTRLREISAQSGATVICKDGNVHIISGTEEERKHARELIGTSVVGPFSAVFFFYFNRDFGSVTSLLKAINNSMTRREWVWTGSTRFPN